jgi:hypothetical protein
LICLKEFENKLLISRKIPKSMIGQQEGGKKEGLVINKLKRYD